MDILFISPTYTGVGGLGPHAFRVSEKLNQEGHHVELMDVPHVPIKNRWHTHQRARLEKLISKNRFSE